MIQPDTSPNISIDTSGLVCPHPLIKAKQALKGLDIGQILQVCATDPSAHIDFEVFQRQTQHSLLKSWEQDHCYYFLIQKGGAGC